MKLNHELEEHRKEIQDEVNKKISFGDITLKKVLGFGVLGAIAYSSPANALIIAAPTALGYAAGKKITKEEKKAIALDARRDEIRYQDRDFDELGADKIHSRMTVRNLKLNKAKIKEFIATGTGIGFSLMALGQGWINPKYTLGATIAIAGYGAYQYFQNERAIERQEDDQALIVKEEARRIEERKKKAR